MMKRVLSVVLALALLLTLAGALGGCRKEQKPLRVLIDMPITYGDQDSWLANFQTLITQNGGPEGIEFEFLPSRFDASERKMALTRMRTEIMAGQGPDVMILSPSTSFEPDGDGSYSTNNSALFLMPEKIMENGLLMPLDKYIEKAQFMEWDRLTPAVMAAGYNETYGQVILPLSYTFPVTAYRASDLPKAPEANTWGEMLESDNPILRDAAVHILGGDGNLMKTNAALSDPSERKLTFTEEELLARAEELYALLKERMEARRLENDEGIDDGVPDSYQFNMAINYTSDNRDHQLAYYPDRNWWNRNFLLDLNDSEPLTMLPAYSPEGGVTAHVQAYACINANTKQPDNAFFVLDMLLSPEEQRSSGMGIWTTFMRGVSVCEGLMTEENPVAIYFTGNWCMSEENYAEFSRVRNQITAARFYGTLDVELENLYVQIYNSVLNGDEVDLETLVSQTYMRMRQEVSE